MATSKSLSRSEVASRVEPPDHRRADVRPHLQEAMALLLQAYDYARELDQDSWDMAVELQVLRTAKITNSDLRWLAAKGYIEHGVETTLPEDRARHFRHTPLLTFIDSTCVVLTSAGVIASREVCSAGPVIALADPERGLCTIAAADEPTGPPRWDHQRRQLRMGAELVKEFKLPSPNQETVLMAFEEEGWPPRIDDPLPPVAQLDSRRRLHDTIKALNRKQKRELIRFRGDGSGEGIRWEPSLGSAGR